MIVGRFPAPIFDSIINIHQMLLVDLLYPMRRARPPVLPTIWELLCAAHSVRVMRIYHVSPEPQVRFISCCDPRCRYRDIWYNAISRRTTSKLSRLIFSRICSNAVCSHTCLRCSLLLGIFGLHLPHLLGDIFHGPTCVSGFKHHLLFAACIAFAVTRAATNTPLQRLNVP
jgi:hypothetical protein